MVCPRIRLISAPDNPPQTRAHTLGRIQAQISMTIVAMIWADTSINVSRPSFKCRSAVSIFVDANPPINPIKADADSSGASSGSS